MIDSIVRLAARVADVGLAVTAVGVVVMLNGFLVALFGRLYLDNKRS